jgi:AraC family transcriptional regulator of arabinose operon
MAKARELLDTSELAIARIAEQCGYQDPYYFSRIFKKTHSISPARYRQQRNE